MTTKKTPKKITGLYLEDFMTDTILSSPSKMALTMDGKETDHYLMIVGAQSNQVTRARLTWGMKTNALTKMLKTIDDDIEKAITKLEQESKINNAFALELVVGWSFDDYKITKVSALLGDNMGIASGVISHAFAREATLVKK